MPPEKSSDPVSPSHVAIVLGTWNGAAYLGQQLDSLMRQTHTDWSLWVHDDCSEDDTWPMLETFARTARGQGRTVVLERGVSGGGIAASYQWLLTGPGPRLASFTALCDQDDVWHPDRLARGVAALAGHATARRPALHSAAMRLVDGEGTDLGVTRPRVVEAPPPAAFAPALARCPTNAPTILATHAAIALLGQVPLPPHMVAHDWWLVSLVLGCGGTVVQDPALSVDYRQHGHNTLGEIATWHGARRRMALLARREYRLWRDTMIAGLTQAPLTPAARTVVEGFATLPGAGPARARGLRRLGMVRAGRTGAAATRIGATMGLL